MRDRGEMAVACSLECRSEFYAAVVRDSVGRQEGPGARRGLNRRALGRRVLRIGSVMALAGAANANDEFGCIVTLAATASTTARRTVGGRRKWNDARRGQDAHAQCIHKASMILMLHGRILRDAAGLIAFPPLRRTI